MTTTYTKSLSSDFGGILESSQLHKTILADGGISPNILAISVGDPTSDTVKITFDSALDGSEQTVLGGIISTHDPDPQIFEELLFETIISSQSPFTVRNRSLLCDTSGGNITILLPKSTRSLNGILGFKKIDAANTVTINAWNSELIDGQTTYTLTSLNQRVIIKSNGSGWEFYTEETIEASLNSIILPISTIKGSIIVRGVEQVGTKTLYLDRIDYNLNWICIKDIEIDDVSEISNNCQGDHETHMQCNGQDFSGYTCEEIESGIYKITGLQHSGVTQSNDPEEGPGPSVPEFSIIGILLVFIIGILAFLIIWKKKN